MSNTPIWAISEPSSRKPRFSREQIAQAALAIADADGLDALSMRRVAESLGAGTMTLYHYVRTKEDLLALLDDALLGEIADATEPLPAAWRGALKKIAFATRDTCLRHAWILISGSSLRLGPNALRHIEHSLQAVSGLDLSMSLRVEILSIVDDYVFGHCVSLVRLQGHFQLDKKGRAAMNQAINRSLEEGTFPQLRAFIGTQDPVGALSSHAGAAKGEERFEAGLDALLDGIALRFASK